MSRDHTPAHFELCCNCYTLLGAATRGDRKNAGVWLEDEKRIEIVKTIRQTTDVRTRGFCEHASQFVSLFSESSRVLHALCRYQLFVHCVQRSFSRDTPVARRNGRSVFCPSGSRGNRQISSSDGDMPPLPPYLRPQMTTASRSTRPATRSLIKLPRALEDNLEYLGTPLKPVAGERERADTSADRRRRPAPLAQAITAHLLDSASSAGIPCSSSVKSRRHPRPNGNNREQLAAALLQSRGLARMEHDCSVDVNDTYLLSGHWMKQGFRGSTWNGLRDSQNEELQNRSATALYATASRAQRSGLGRRSRRTPQDDETSKSFREKKCARPGQQVTDEERLVAALPDSLTSVTSASSDRVALARDRFPAAALEPDWRDLSSSGSIRHATEILTSK